MKHLGDITNINGAEIPPVNVIIGGSPCQDLSIAGKRAGLAGERSGLFMEQIRIIKEMRKADENRGRSSTNIRPRFMVWENVPGAFSSNKGEDFGAVLQETARIVCKEAPIIPVPKKGWPTAGCINGVGDRGGLWSIAWRVFDAQFWGVPQRRRRIALVADFGGNTAPEILFERESLYGYSSESRAEREGITRDVEDCITGNDRVLEDEAGNLIPCTLKIRSGCEGGGKGALVQMDKSATLSTRQDQTLFAPTTYCIQGNCIDRADTAGCNGKGWTEGVSYTLNTVDRPAVAVSMIDDQGGSRMSSMIDAKVSPTLRAEAHGNIPIVFEPGSCSRVGGHVYEDNISPTLRANAGDNQPAVAMKAYAIENHPNDSRVKLSTDNVIQTLSGRMGTGGGNTPMILEKFKGGGGVFHDNR